MLFIMQEDLEQTECMHTLISHQKNYVTNHWKCHVVAQLPDKGARVSDNEPFCHYYWWDNT